MNAPTSVKNLTTLGVIHEKVSDMAKNYRDELVPVKDVTFNDFFLVNIGTEEYRISPIAQMSISNRLGIPLQYLKKCPDTLAAINLNHWITKEKNEHLFFRFDEGLVRAMFTPKYQPMDNLEIIEKLMAIGYSPRQKVQCHIDGSFMGLNLLNEENGFAIKGDAFTPGISVSNSEVGLASVSVAAFCLRLVCTNGLVSKTQVSESYKHISRKLFDDFPQVLNKVSAELQTQKRQFAIAMESPVKDMAASLNTFNARYQLKEEERKAIEWAIPFENGETMFTLINIYTKASQMAGLSAESRFRLQKTGGQILAMVN